MTRKHFTQLAQMLRFTKPDTDGEAMTLWLRIVQETGDICQAANPNFDRVRFNEAVNA